MDVKLLAVGGLLAGVGVGAYVLSRPKTTSTPNNSPTPIPVTPNPVPPIASTELMCAQVVTKCADGSWASTPCGCRDKGGAARPEPGTFIAEPRPLPTPEVIAVAGVPVRAVEPVIAPPTTQPVYSDIEDRPIWDRSEGPLWS
ncbi:MAG: hypothetical protein N3C58_04845 [Meiothermus ruber]|nr:hypothetical protein [Meiothermus ruber]